MTLLQPFLSLGTTLLAQQGAGPAPGTGGGGAFGLGIMPLMLAIGVLFYWMVLRPESKRRKAQGTMHKELKKNDRILMISGIYGTVVNAPPGSDEITIKVDESSNTKLRITRSAVQSVLNNKEGSE